MIKALFIILFGLLSIESIDEYEKAKKHNKMTKKIFILGKISDLFLIFYLIYFFFDNSKDPNLIFALSVMKPFAIFACFVLFLYHERTYKNEENQSFYRRTYSIMFNIIILCRIFICRKFNYIFYSFKIPNLHTINHISVSFLFYDQDFKKRI